MQPRFAHFSIRAADLERSVRFYADAFGFEVGYRPPFNFDGRWLYLHGMPILHLIGDRSRSAHSQDFIDHKARAPAGRGSGALDHVALCLPAAELEGFLANLDSHAIAHARRTVPLSGYQQVFVEDPDGITIEVLFDQ